MEVLVILGIILGGLLIAGALVYLLAALFIIIAAVFRGRW